MNAENAEQRATDEHRKTLITVFFGVLLWPCCSVGVQRRFLLKNSSVLCQASFAAASS
jgi:hypothetical protein